MSLPSKPNSCNSQDKSLKRKRINEFFLPTAKVPRLLPPSLETPKSPPSPIQQPSASLPIPIQTSVPGLEILENFITPTEEASLLTFLNDPSKCTWRTDLSRRTMHFGGTYCLFTPRPTTRLLSSSTPENENENNKTTNPQKKTKPEIITAPPIPPELNWLLDRLTTHSIFPLPRRPQYLIINEYVHSQGISAHVENFAFGEPVVGLSLLSPVNMRFHELRRPDDGSVRSGKAGRAERTGRSTDVRLRGRGVVVMSGPSRWGWQHEIVRSAKGRGTGWKRVSLTLRWKDE